MTVGELIAELEKLPKDLRVLVAGEEAEKEVGAVSMMASDTVNHIPDAIKRLRKAIEKYNK